MSQSIVHAVFPSHSSAEGAMIALSDSGFRPSEISVIGEDSDSFRQATAVLQSTKADRLMLWLGLAGAAIGSAVGAFGVHYMPGFDATYITPVTLTAAFSGFAVGLCSGLAMGAILRLDSPPPFEAQVRLGSVRDGEMAISVVTEDVPSTERAQNIMSSQGATHISIDLATQTLQPLRELVLDMTA